MKKQKILMFILGLLLGSVVAFLIISPKTKKESNDNGEIIEKTTENDSNFAEMEQEEIKQESTTENIEKEVPSGIQEWSESATYNGGDQVSYKGRVYKAKWWTQGETPESAEVWEDTKVSAETTTELPQEEKEPEVVKKEATTPEDFKVVGYYPSWKAGEMDKIRYDVLTHVVYSFAIPTEEGSLRPLDNPDCAKKIIKTAHQSNCKVLLAVGGWSYQEIPLEPTFIAATETKEKREKFAKELLKLCDDFGFDGIDMDWEHPRIDGSSGKQYEDLMLMLSEELHKRDKTLTSAVLSGVSADGNILYDAAAHSDQVLAAVDWIHVMAYDGGDGERHSPYNFAINSGKYWQEKRGLPAEKVVLGLPFYARPSWESYDKILQANKDAWKKDTVSYNGMEVWLNAAPTIQKKTEYALENLGGVMVWEITQDTKDKKKSLLTAIKETISNKK